MPYYQTIEIEINGPQQEDQTPENPPVGYPAPDSRHPGSPGRTPYGSPSHPDAPLPPLLMRSPSPSMRTRSASGWSNRPTSPSQHSQGGRSNSRYTPSPPSTPEDARSCSNYLPHIRRTPWTRRSVSTSPSASPNMSSHWSLLVEPPSSPRSDSPAPVIPPVIPRNECDVPTPYIPARPPANVGYIQPPAWAYYLPGEYPGVPCAQVNAHVFAASGPDAELPAHTDARYQVNGPTYPTSLAQQRSPWLFPDHCAPAHGCHHHQPGSTNVNVSTNGDVGVVRVTVRTQPR